MKTVISIPLDRIVVGERLRGVDPDFAAWIGASMKDRGQDTPITVAEANDEGKHPLIAGGHRVEGARLIGWSEIEAIVFAGSEMEAELLQIEENLARHELNALDRAVFLERHNTLYQAPHPAAKKGGDRKSDQWLSGGLRSAGFADAVREKLGLAKATINAAIKMASAIPPDVRAKLVGTPVARSVKELAALARLTGFEQREVVSVLLERGGLTVVDALRVVRRVPEPAVDERQQQLARLVGAWTKASFGSQRMFLEFLADTIPQQLRGVMAQRNLLNAAPAKAKAPPKTTAKGAK